MGEETSQERLSIRTASKALEVSEKSVQRYIERGILTKIKENHRVYLLSDEVRELRKKRQAVSRQKPGQQAKPTITISVDTYSSLLTELADMKARANYLLEYKNINDKLTRQLDQNIGQTDELKQSKKDLQSELDRMRSRGILKRILNK